MTEFIVRRLLQAALVVAVMSLLVFTGVYAIGDPVELLINPEADQATRDMVASQLGLDQPLWRQYTLFVANALQGDLGRSFVFNIPAIELILQRMPATLELAALATLIALVLGVPLGLYAGMRPYSPVSHTIMTGSILGFSLPTFWVGLLLILVFAVWLGWLPAFGRGKTASVFGVEWSVLTLDGLRHIVLPAANLALFKLALIIRLTQAGAREAALQDYVRFAKARGIAPSRVLFVHILRNLMIPIVTVAGIEFGGVVAFAVVTESIFNWPGMGKLIIDSINLLDRPVIVAYLVVIVFFFVLINLLVDLLYTLLDPRVRLSGGSR